MTPATPEPARLALRKTIKQPARDVRSQQTQQQHVITDPTKASGDPAHGYATAVLGNLTGYGALTGFGVAAYAGGEWKQVT